MKKVLKVKCRTKRICCLIAFWSVVGYSLYLSILIWFYTIEDRKDIWLMSLIVGTCIYAIIISVAYLCVIKHAKNTQNRIYLMERICQKGSKSIRYQKIDVDQTGIQRIFKLVTLKFIGSSETLILKDVSERVLDYL